MRCKKGRWYYQGREWPTLRAALLAAWTAKEAGHAG